MSSAGGRFLPHPHDLEALSQGRLRSFEEEKHELTQRMWERPETANGVDTTEKQADMVKLLAHLVNKISASGTAESQPPIDGGHVHSEGCQTQDGECVLLNGEPRLPNGCHPHNAPNGGS